MKSILYACLFTGLMLCTCKKEQPLTPEELLIGKWQLLKLGMQQPLGTAEQISLQPESSYFQFDKNGKVTIHLNMTAESTWNMEPGGQILHISSFSPDKLEITTLNSKELTFYRDKVENGQTNRDTYYFVKQ